MRFHTILALALVLVLSTSAFGLERKAYQIREDYGHEPLYDCALQYYYYIPCPTYSWFWVFTGWDVGDIIGECFAIGDEGTGGYLPCDPTLCQTLEILRVLDFAGYGTVYPGLFTTQYDVYCVNEYCCDPVPPQLHIYQSEPVELHYGWNYYYFDVDPDEPDPQPLCITPCCTVPLPDCMPIIFITATMIGTEGIYPAWGWDNLSTPLGDGCVMQDIGCMPAVYPRYPCDTYSFPMVHSGYVGSFPFEYWPPLCFLDGADTAFHFGCLDLAWRIYLICEGPTATQPSTWGHIKRIYK